jgi:hypothetical protein
MKSSTLCAYVLMHLHVSVTKDYVRNFQQKMQNEANRKDRIQNTEYRRQDKKVCISIFQIKDCVAIVPANCLSCYYVIISGQQGNEPKRTQSQRQNTEYGIQKTGMRIA